MNTQILIILCNIFFLTFLAPSIAVFYSKRGTKTLKPFLCGIAAYILSQELLRRLLVVKLAPNLIFYRDLRQNLYSYGLFLGITSALCDGIVRLYVLKFCKMGNSIKKGIAFGIGQAWIVGLVTNGSYMLELLDYVFKEPFFLSFYPKSDLICALIDRVISLFYYAGLTLLMQYALLVQKKAVYTISTIIYHTLVNTGIFYLITILHQPAWLVDFFYFMISAMVFLVGYYDMMSTRHHKIVSVFEKGFWKGLLPDK